MLSEGEMLDLIITWLPPGGRVLDIGCGSGRLLTALTKRGVSGMGIDPHASDAEHCRHLRAEEMDQLADRFDLVYTRYTLHHLDAPQRFPEKVRSVLCPSGILLIVDWVKGARTGVPERYLAPQTVAGWVSKAGFQLLCEDVRGQSMVVVGKLPAAGLEPKSRRSERNKAQQELGVVISGGVTFPTLLYHSTC
jgi:SAM-dependent methyltransferase